MTPYPFKECNVDTPLDIKQRPYLVPWEKILPVFRVCDMRTAFDSICPHPSLQQLIVVVHGKMLHEQSMCTVCPHSW